MGLARPTRYPYTHHRSSTGREEIGLRCRHPNLQTLADQHPLPFKESLLAACLFPATGSKPSLEPRSTWPRAGAMPLAPDLADGDRKACAMATRGSHYRATSVMLSSVGRLDILPVLSRRGLQPHVAPQRPGGPRWRPPPARRLHPKSPGEGLRSEPGWKRPRYGASFQDVGAADVKPTGNLGQLPPP